MRGKGVDNWPPVLRCSKKHGINRVKFSIHFFNALYFFDSNTAIKAKNSPLEAIFNKVNHFFQQNTLKDYQNICFCSMAYIIAGLFLKNVKESGTSFQANFWDRKFCDEMFYQLTNFYDNSYSSWLATTSPKLGSQVGNYKLETYFYQL